jgi:hypothetical protein
MKVRAGSSPPISSMTIWTDGLARVGGERQARQVDPVARPGEVRVGHAPEGEAAPRALGHLRAVALEDLGHAAADRTQT